MNRRSVLRWLGLAPVAAPAAVAAASAPAMPPIDYSGLAADARERIEQAFRFDAESGTLSVPSLQIHHAALPEGSMTLKVSADNALARRIDGLIARVG
ncbi:hypothetical protein [Methylorubrum thiocyanatum]|uniref:hypothetical protein n=1 Tax=Methylorubrum thiocyanatum TaxID=47958 RepID=UPI0036524FD7